MPAKPKSKTTTRAGRDSVIWSVCKTVSRIATSPLVRGAGIYNRSSGAGGVSGTLARMEAISTLAPRLARSAR